MGICSSTANRMCFYWNVFHNREKVKERNEEANINNKNKYNNQELVKRIVKENRRAIVGYQT